MSRKLSRNIKKAEKIIKKFIGGGIYEDHEFDYSDSNSCVWSAVDPVDGDILTGTFDFDRTGIVNYHSYTVRTSFTPDLFVGTSLISGRRSFKKNAKSHNKAFMRGAVSDIIGVSMDPVDAQPLAYLFDSLWLLLF